MTADGAYDGEPVYQAIVGHQPDPLPDIVIPPRASAVPSTRVRGAEPTRSPHPAHCREGPHGLAESDRLRPAQSRGDRGGRYKAIIGPKLRARILPAQQGEIAMAAEVLNHMIRVAKPVSIRVA